jgi:4-amino-4-deoxy-L-arabinose transferase-like glycosyltransferase
MSNYSSPPEYRRYARGSELLLLIVFCGFFFFYRLSAFGLMGADEPRYAQVAREMWQAHDWVTPTLWGKPWLEKPALYYWGAILSYKITGGVSDWAARAGDAVMASLMIFGIYFMLRRIRPQIALDAALITAAAAAIFGFARGADTDMPLAAFFTLGMLAWMVWYASGEETGGRRQEAGNQEVGGGRQEAGIQEVGGRRQEAGRARTWLAAFYFFIGVATLAKGPVAPGLAGLIIILFVAWKREWNLALRMLWIPGILVFFATALPWYVLVQVRNPQFFGEFILRQNFARFGTNLYQHHKPIWFYIPVLLGSLLPWSVLAMFAFIAALRSSIAVNAENAGSTHDRKEVVSEVQSHNHAITQSLNPITQSHNFSRFLVLWAITPILFFTLAQSKLPGYILPAIPAWTILAAEYLQQLREGMRRLNFAVLAGHAALVGLSVAAALLSPYAIVQKQFHPPLSALLVAAVFAAAFFIIIMYSVRRRGVGSPRFLTSAAVILSLAYLLRVVAPATDAVLSARPLARYISQMQNAPADIAVYNLPRGIQYGLAFYRNQRVPRYDGNLDGPGEVPAGEHLLLMAGASANTIVLPFQLSGREFTIVGRFAPQDLLMIRVAASR